MAIVSYGYPYSIAPGSIMARFGGSWGHRYAVPSFSDFRVTIAAGSGTRRVNIASGWSMGQSVMVNNTTTATKDLDAPAGSQQWFLIGLKRWADNPIYDPEATPGTPEAEEYISEVVAVAGNASRLVPAVVQTPGDDDTQWLALARVISSSTDVQEVLDLRLVSREGGGFYEVYSDLAMAQLDDAVGAEVYRVDTIDGHRPTTYKRISSASGVLSWKDTLSSDETLLGLSATASAVSGWQRSEDACRLDRNGDHRKLRLVVNRGPGAGTIQSNTRGGFSGVGSQPDAYALAALHTIDLPPAGIQVPMYGRVRTVANNPYTAAGLISAGNANLIGTAPDITIAYSGSNPAEVILEADWYV